MGTVYQHSDWETFLEQALRAERPVDAVQYGRVSRKTTDERGNFYGTRTWQEALTFVEDGWPEGREMMGRILTEVNLGESEVPKKRVTWDVEGDCVDVGRFCGGEPECMMRWTERPSKLRRCRILVNLSVSAGVRHEEIKWKGACVLALVDRLESAGIRCEIDLGFGLDDKWIETINCKQADEPLHIDRMAFFLVHPACYRRIFFSYQEASRLRDKPGRLISTECGCYEGGGYGMPMKDISEYLPEGEKYDLVISGMQLDGVEDAITEMEKLFDQVCASKSEYTEHA